MLENSPLFDDVLFRGKRLLSNVIDQVSEITVDMGVGQVTELSFTIEDPALEILSSGVFDINTKVTYKNLDLVVAVIETGPGGGIGGFTVRCRPQIVNKLKKRRGKKVYNNIRPTQFCRSEVRRAGGKFVGQKTAKRDRIARDVALKGESYDPASFPSSWTTMQRLADEVGFVMFEVGGTIYFGKPTWLVNRLPKVEVEWYPENTSEPYSIPSFRQSIDNEDVEVSIELPIQRAGNVMPGQGLVLSGFPKFAGTYMINNVTYPLVGPGTVTVSASTVKNPEPQKGGDESGTGGGGGSRPQANKGKPLRNILTSDSEAVFGLD